MSPHTAQRDAASASLLRELIRAELAPFPGRGLMVVRLVLSTALVILTAMTLSVPFLSLSMIMVLFTTQENTVFTRLTGTMIWLGVNLAVATGIVLVKFTIDYPMLRILCACAIAFCAMYFMRISRLGAIGYLIALFVFYTQSFVDLGLSPEALLRSVLWFWVAMTYPIVITVVVTTLVARHGPANLLADEMERQIDRVLAQLHARCSSSKPPTLPVSALASGVLSLHRHLAFAVKVDGEYQRRRIQHVQRIAAIDRLHTAAAHLARLREEPLSPAQIARIAILEANLEALRASVTTGLPFSHSGDLGTAEPARTPLDAILREMALALETAAEAERAADAEPPKVEPIFASDALTNPVYGQFALKTIVAAMICYVFYTSLSWPGIHTSMLTCFILALPSLGAGSHKGLLRIVGCALGSAVALVATVFVTPHLDTIAGLLLLTLPIVAAGAWVAAGSPRSNYIGVQFVFTFALAQLGRFGPYSDVTEIRDRMVGILIGVAVYIGVSAWLWPEREAPSFKSTVGRVLRSVANLVRAPDHAGSQGNRQAAIDASRLQVWSSLAQARDQQVRVVLEPGDRDDGSTWIAWSNASLTRAREAVLAVEWLHVLGENAGSGIPRPVTLALQAFCSRVAAQLESFSDRLNGQGTQDTASEVKDALEALERRLDQYATRAIPCLAEIRAAAEALSHHIAHLDPRRTAAAVR